MTVSYTHVFLDDQCICVYRCSHEQSAHASVCVGAVIVEVVALVSARHVDVACAHVVRVSAYNIYRTKETNVAVRTKLLIASRHNP